MKEHQQSCRKNRQLRLYIHIPFCVSKCYYCDFFSHVASDEEKIQYVNNLILDIKNEANKYREYSIPSIFIGGGTPSSLSAVLMRKIIRQLFVSFNIEDMAEISMEMNPKTVTKKKLIEYKKMGINRLSIGMQSTKDEELQALGRSHNYVDFLDAYQWAREIGFQNINIDIMEAVPGQTMQTYLETLQKTCALKPEHISSYSLILEEETKFYDWYIQNKDPFKKERLPLPTEEEERKMYKLTKKILEEHGYMQYEISNYAKPGFECKHNIGYWIRDNYLGFGETASSMIENVRWTNQREEKHKLSMVEQMEEFMFLGLRLMEGISIALFEKKFSKSIYEVYKKEIESLRKEKLIRCTEKGYLQLTPRGVDLSNYVFVKFLQNDV